MTALPRQGPSIGKGGFGEVFIDPDDENLCIKVFKSPLRGAEAQRLLDLVELAGTLRSSERTFLTTRFAWPLEAFGTARKILGYRMPRVPESGVFDLLVAGRMSQQVLQAKYLLDSSWWGRDAVQSEPPQLVEDGRLLIVADALEAFKLLHSHGYAYEDLSSNNVCVLNNSLPGVFLLDADSVIPIDGASRDIVRSVDWDVDERLGPAERDWVKAAIFVWRMLLQDRLARPERDRIADFDDRTSTILGGSILELHEYPGLEAVDQLLESIYGELMPDTQRALIDTALDGGFAREVLRYQDLAHMDSEVRLVAESQIALESRVDESTGLQRRLLLRGLRERGQAAFHLDILPGAISSAPPKSVEELERLVLAAEFDGLLDNFLDGELAAFEGHPWRDRAIQHALVMEPGPDIEIADIEGIATARFHWPPGELVDAARLRILSAGQLIDERLIERQRDHSSVRVRGIGSGFPEGQRLDVHITFCVRGEDGGVIECPAGAVETVTAPARPQRTPVRTPRAIREAERRSSLPGEAALDVARPDPNAPRERRRRRRRRVVAGAVAILAAATLFLWGGEDELRIDAIATRTGEGSEVVWAVRSDVQGPVTIQDATLQRRIVGPIWIGREQTGFEGRVVSGTTVRMATPASGTLRIKAEVVGHGTVRSGPLKPITPELATVRAPEPVSAPTWKLLDDGRGSLAWSLPEPDETRIVERVQILVLDTQGNRILRTSTGDLGLTIGASVVTSAPSGLDIRVRIITSDGMRSDWSTVLTGPVASEFLPRPTGLEVIRRDADAAILTWDYPTSELVGASQRFEVVIRTPRSNESRLLQVNEPFVSLEDIFADVEAGILVLRVRAVLPDGTLGPLSSARIVRELQLGNTQ